MFRAGLNPRFLVLLLAMQQFKNQHWGLSRHIDPNFGELSKASAKVFIENPKEGLVDIELDWLPSSLNLASASQRF